MIASPAHILNGHALRSPDVTPFQYGGEDL